MPWAPWLRSPYGRPPPKPPLAFVRSSRHPFLHESWINRVSNKTLERGRCALCLCLCLPQSADRSLNFKGFYPQITQIAQISKTLLTNTSSFVIPSAARNPGSNPLFLVFSNLCNLRNLWMRIVLCLCPLSIRVIRGFQDDVLMPRCIRWSFSKAAWRRPSSRTWCRPPGFRDCRSVKCRSVESRGSCFPG